MDGTVTVPSIFMHFAILFVCDNGQRIVRVRSGLYENHVDNRRFVEDLITQLELPVSRVYRKPMWERGCWHSPFTFLLEANELMLLRLMLPTEYFENPLDDF